MRDCDASPRARSGRCLAVWAEAANPNLFSFSPPTPKPRNLSWTASLPCLSLHGSPSLAGLLGTGVLALSSTPQLSVWRRPQICWGPAGKAFLFQVPEGSSSQLSLRAPPSDARQMETREERTLGVRLMQARKRPIVAQAPLGLLLALRKGPSRQKQEWLGPGPLGEPRVPAQRLPAPGRTSQWLLSPERGAGLPVALEVLSQAPGAWSGRPETKQGVAKAGRREGAESPPHDHLMSR